MNYSVVKEEPIKRDTNISEIVQKGIKTSAYRWHGC